MPRKIDRTDAAYSDGRHVWEHVCTECGSLVAVTTVGANERPVYDECECTYPSEANADAYLGCSDCGAPMDVCACTS